MGLQKKASLYSGVGLLFLVAILAAIGAWVVRDTTDRSLNERVAFAQMVSRQVDLSLLAAQNELVTLAAMADLTDGESQTERQALANLFIFSGTFSHVFLTDSTGRIVAAESLDPTLQLQEIADADVGLTTALAASRAVITSVFMQSPERQPMFSISVPITDGNGEVVGSVTGHLDLDGIVGSFIEPLGLGGTAYMEVLSQGGRVMVSSGDHTASPEEADYSTHFASLIDGGEATQGQCFSCHGEGNGNVVRTRQVLAFAPLRAVAGGVAIRQTEAEALAPTRRLVRYMLFAGCPLLILGLVFTWMSTRMVVRPVLTLTAASRRIAAGDLEVPITTSRHDELGQLAETFDRMRVGLRDSLSQMEDRATESEQRARDLAAMVAENTRLRDQVQELAIVEERTRLSREMHDSLGQVLAYVRLETDEITRLLGLGEVGAASAKVVGVGKAVSEASGEVRQAVLALRTPSSPGLELPKMLQQYLESFRSQTGIEVSLDVRDSAAVRFAPLTALQLVRVVQEALNNVRKYAVADHAGLTFEVRDRQAVLTISDDGVGFDVSHVYAGGQHFGIQVMTERMASLGGSLEIDSAAGQGTRVVVRLPLEGNGGEQ